MNGNSARATSVDLGIIAADNKSQSKSGDRGEDNNGDNENRKIRLSLSGARV